MKPRLHKNIKGVKKTLERFIDFSGAVENSAEMVNNYDWMKNLYFSGFCQGYRKAYHCELYDG